MRSPMKRGFTLIELLVVIAIIAILASILFPVFSKAREKARQATCTSQIRQIATAVQMYAQDNGGQYPGIDGGAWVGKLTNYLGNSEEMFQCPSDTSGDSGKVSYAYAGILIRANGTGVKEASVKSPSEVGCVADASPSETYPSGRLIGGGGSQTEASIAAKPEARHSKGIVAGFCDGHAKYISGSFDEKDMASEVTRGFYEVASLGLIDNPLGCINDTAAFTYGGNVTVGGEYATYPLLMAAATMGGRYYTRGFLGEDNITGRPLNEWVWGYASDAPGWAATTAIAYDAICVIVAKGSKIPALPSYANSTYLRTTGQMAYMLTRGFVENSVQVYKMSDNTSTTKYIKNVLAVSDFGADAVQVENDFEMVEKISNDPYGIGYCSTTFADPDRVTILAIDGATTDAYWPRESKKFRWVLPERGDTTWPWIRSLDVTASGTEALKIQTALRTGAFADALYLGPLFKVGYWAGNY